MKAIILILMLIMAAGLAGSCIIIEGEDIMNTKEYDFKDFTRIEAGSAFEVEVEQSDSFKISISADDFSHIKVEKTGDTLVIKRQGIEWFPPFHGRPKAKISMPVLTGVNFSGALKGTVRNFQSGNDLEINICGASSVQADNISAGKLDIKVSGASTLRGDIKAAKDVKFESVGASRIELTGAGADARITVSGASRAELDDFPIHDANLNVAGASHAVINIKGRLDAAISGASHLYWSGNPAMGNISASGASTIGSK